MYAQTCYILLFSVLQASYEACRRRVRAGLYVPAPAHCSSVLLFVFVLFLCFSPRGERSGQIRSSGRQCVCHPFSYICVALLVLLDFTRCVIWSNAWLSWAYVTLSSAGETSRCRSAGAGSRRPNISGDMSHALRSLAGSNHSNNMNDTFYNHSNNN